MKSFKFFGFFAALFSLFIFSGCALQAVSDGLGVLGAMGDAHNKITRPDFSISLNAGLDKMPGVAKTALEELGVNFKDAKKSDDGDSVVIMGNAPKGIVVKILAVKVTAKATDVSVWAYQEGFINVRNPDLAIMVGAQLLQQVDVVDNRNPFIEEAKSASEVKNDPAPELEKAPEPVKKPTVKKKAASKKKPLKKKPAVGKDG